MNENINLCEILKDCPRRTKLWCDNFGEVEFEGFKNSNEYPIALKLSDGSTYNLTKNGNVFACSNYCVLWPSKDVRTWQGWECPKPKKPKFDPKTLQPFDKVLVRLGKEYYYTWYADFVSIPSINGKAPHTMSESIGMIIPYNDDTKHLIGTFYEAPEYYRY